MAEIIAQTLGQTRVRQRKARTAGERPAVGAPSECARVCGVATTGRRRGKSGAAAVSIDLSSTTFCCPAVKCRDDSRVRHLTQQRSTRLPGTGSGGRRRVTAVEMVRLKVACLQTDPVHGDPASGMRTADEHLARLTRDDGVHILLLPEMAFSGYCFDDVADVSRVVETDDGPTVRWCASTPCGWGARCCAGTRGACPRFRTKAPLALARRRGVLYNYNWSRWAPTGTR